MNNETLLQLAKESVREWEQNPSMSWDELDEKLKVWVKEIKEGVTYETN